MNEKEVSELRRRYRADKSNISRVRGCYVNTKGEILAEFDQSLGLMTTEESDEILAILKKTLSGTLGKNLIDIAFTNAQVTDSEEHKTLMTLKNTSLANEEEISTLYKRIISSVHFESCYLILLASDKYDVYTRSSDGSRSDESDEVFSYIVCSVCPVKSVKPSLIYYANENIFRNSIAESVVGAPELGFIFPSFDNRTANIFNALMYTRNIADSRSEFVDAVFKCETPMSAMRQKELFGSILEQSVSDDCDFEVVQTVHRHLSDLIEAHKESKEETPLTVTKDTVREVLELCNVTEERISSFEDKYNEEFGSKTELNPQNIVDIKQFEVRTADVAIKVNPERSDLVETRIIDGVKYILIRADENVEVNGVNIHIND